MEAAIEQVVNANIGRVGRTPDLNVVQQFDRVARLALQRLVRLDASACRLRARPELHARHPEWRPRLVDENRRERIEPTRSAPPSANYSDISTARLVLDGEARPIDSAVDPFAGRTERSDSERIDHRLRRHIGIRKPAKCSLTLAPTLEAGRDGSCRPRRKSRGHRHGAFVCDVQGWHDQTSREPRCEAYARPA